VPDNRDKTLATRERLLAAGLRAFAHQGYREASLSKIASEARVTTGSIYRQFRDKEDFFVAVAERTVDGLTFELRRLALPYEDLETAVEHLARGYRALVDESPEWPLLIAELVRLQATKVDTFAPYRALHSELAATLERVARNARLEIRWPTPAIVQSAGVSLHALAVDRVRDPQSMPDEVFDDLAAAILRWALQRAPTLAPDEVVDRHAAHTPYPPPPVRPGNLVGTGGRLGRSTDDPAMTTYPSIR
jgi:AcrR family transcriptional regulator